MLLTRGDTTLADYNNSNGIGLTGGLSGYLFLNKKVSAFAFMWNIYFNLLCRLWHSYRDISAILYIHSVVLLLLLWY